MNTAATVRRWLMATHPHDPPLVDRRRRTARPRWAYFKSVDFEMKHATPEDRLALEPWRIRRRDDSTSCAEWRIRALPHDRKESSVPIVMLTARGE